MRNQLLLFVLLILLLSNCDERVEKNEIDTDNSLFTKSVGGSISPEVAARWVERRRSHTSVREQNFNVTADKLNALLDQVDDKLGVILHHAQGPDGERHLFITPVKSDLQSWSNGSVLDAATNEFTDASQAKNWVLDYKEKHPDGPWSHFYGIDLFNEIRAIEALNRLEIIEGEAVEKNGALHGALKLREAEKEASAWIRKFMSRLIIAWYALCHCITETCGTI